MQVVGFRQKIYIKQCDNCCERLCRTAKGVLNLSLHLSTASE